MAIAGAVACGGAPSAGPPEIHLGLDACDGCGMTITDVRYAAAAAEGSGGEASTVKFDDIGCLARWQADPTRGALGVAWVHDRDSGAWIDAASASFAQVQELPTPMGSGVAAFAVAASADAFAGEHGGERLSWSAVLAQAGEGSLAARSRTAQESHR
jgi:copper chaperone NosL